MNLKTYIILLLMRKIDYRQVYNLKIIFNSINKAVLEPLVSPAFATACFRDHLLVKLTWKLILILAQMTPGWPQMTPVIPLKIASKWTLLSTKFQVYKKNYDLRWPLEWMSLRWSCKYRQKLILKWRLYPLSFKSIYKSSCTNITLHHLHDPYTTFEWPLGDLQIIQLEIGIIPTKFHNHMTVYTNRTKKICKWAT